MRTLKEQLRSLLLLLMFLCFAQNATVSAGTTGTPPVGWCDDFEGYPLGSFPSPPWYCSGNCGGAYIDDSVSYSGSQSFHFYGVIGGCWAAVAARPLEVEFPFIIEMAVWNGTESLSGCHPKRGHLQIKACSTWTCPSRLGLFHFLSNGDLEVNAGQHRDTISGFTLDEWHATKITLSLLGDDSLRVGYWIDDTFLGEYTVSEESWMSDASDEFLMISSEEGTTWFDDVCITPCLTTGAMIVPGTMYAFQANSIDPLMDTVYLYGFPEGYSASDVDPTTLLINSSITPTSSLVTSEDTLRVTFSMTDFILGYIPLWDTTNQVYTVSGQFNDGTCFSSAGEVTMIGHKSGDLNFDGAVNVADLTYLVDFLFTGGPPPSIMVAADLDGNCAVNIADLTYLVDYLFAGGPRPKIPCGSM